MNTNRISLWILAVVMCIGVFVSCGTSEDVGGTGGVATGTGDAAESDPSKEEKLGVPETANYGGETFNILTAGNVAYEDFIYEEESALPL